jgi:hypothetical protein
LFLEGRLGANHQRQDYNLPNTKDRTFGFLLSAYPGLSYRVSRKLQLETGFAGLVSFNYSRTKRTSLNGTQPVTDISNSFGMNTSLNNVSELYAGFRLLIN